jgi:5-methylcytosine-specific restriction enzyme A
LDADVIIMAINNHGSRAIVNDLAATYLLPFIDVGVRVGSKEKHLLSGRWQNAGAGEMPTAAEFMRALKAAMPLPQSYLNMLQFHYNSPNRTVTPASMANGVGYKNFRAANLHYGKLARLIRTHLALRKPAAEAQVELLVKFEWPQPNRICHWIMRKEFASTLEGLGYHASPVELLPGEMPETTSFSQGAVHRVAITAYERNPEARKRCLDHYGASCVICGFDFKAKYGPKAEGFIHVHHLRMLSEIGKNYRIDPIKDLRPVCPNCHSVIHLESPPFTINQLKAMVTARIKATSLSRH